MSGHPVGVPYPSPMPKVDMRGWGQVASGLVIVASAVVLAVTLHRSWSWPLFVWGAVLGPVASAWAFYTTKAFARGLMKQATTEKEELRAREQALWPKYRATYAATVLIGIGIGILAAGMHNPLPDWAFTAMWVLVGVLPPLIAYPVIKRRVAAGSIVAPIVKP